MADPLISASEVQWRPVVGYEQEYEISDTGLIRSLDRHITTKAGVRKHLRGGGVLATSMIDGRCTVQLCVKGVSRRHAVGVLMLEAFVGPRPFPGAFCLHWDDDQQHNRIENLRWGTRSDNLHDSVRNGGHYQSKKAHCPSGHAYDEENTRIYRGRRYCRKCDGWTASGPATTEGGAP